MNNIGHLTSTYESSCVVDEAMHLCSWEVACIIYRHTGVCIGRATLSEKYIRHEQRRTHPNPYMVRRSSRTMAHCASTRKLHVSEWPSLTRSGRVGDAGVVSSSAGIELGVWLLICKYSLSFSLIFPIRESLSCSSGSTLNAARNRETVFGDLASPRMPRHRIYHHPLC